MSGYIHLKKEVWKRVLPQHRILSKNRRTYKGPTFDEVLAGLDKTLAELGDEIAQLRVLAGDEESEAPEPEPDDTYGGTRYFPEDEP